MLKMTRFHSNSSHLDDKGERKTIIGKFSIRQIISMLIEILLPVIGFLLILIINPSYSTPLFTTRVGRFLLLLSGFLSVLGGILLFGMYGVVNHFFPVTNGYSGKRLLVNAFITIVCVGSFSISALVIILVGPTLIDMAGIH